MTRPYDLRPGDMFTRNGQTYTVQARAFTSLHGTHVLTDRGEVTFPRDSTYVHVEIVGVAR